MSNFKKSTLVIFLVCLFLVLLLGPSFQYLIKYSKEQAIFLVDEGRIFKKTIKITESGNISYCEISIENFDELGTRHVKNWRVSLKVWSDCEIGDWVSFQKSKNIKYLEEDIGQ